MGFLNFVSRLLPDRKPGRFYAALDNDWRPAFRVEALPSYKAHRVAPAGGEEVPDGFTYRSDTNDRWLTVEQMREMLELGTAPAGGGQVGNA